MAGEYRWHLCNEQIAKMRTDMLIRLGGKCQSCGEPDLSQLEIHHLNGKTWRSRDVSRFERLRRYEADVKAGLAVLLCDWCHNNPEEHPPECFCHHCRDRF